MEQDQVQMQTLQSSGQSHRLSIAPAIGATIGLIGLVLLLYGLFGQADYSRSAGININLWWGALMLAFGLVMILGGTLSARRTRAPRTAEATTDAAAEGEESAASEPEQAS